MASQREPMLLFFLPPLLALAMLTWQLVVLELQLLLLLLLLVKQMKEAGTCWGRRPQCWRKVCVEIVQGVEGGEGGFLEVLLWTLPWVHWEWGQDERKQHL